MQTLILILIFFLNLSLSASPHPTTGSSMLSSSNHAKALVGLGLQIEKLPKKWNYSGTNQCADCNRVDFTDADSGRISFKLDFANKDAHIDSIIKKYLRDYNLYGFEVGQVKSFTKGDIKEPVYYFDLIQKNNKSRARQFFIKNQSQLVTVSCTDQFEKFDFTLLDCNEIMNQLKLN